MTTEKIINAPNSTLYRLGRLVSSIHFADDEQGMLLCIINALQANNVAMNGECLYLFTVDSLENMILPKDIGVRTSSKSGYTIHIPKEIIVVNAITNPLAMLVIIFLSRYTSVTVPLEIEMKEENTHEGLHVLQHLLRKLKSNFVRIHRQQSDC